MVDQKTKVLIVEDDPLMFRLYAKIFQLEGYSVRTASNGEEGLIEVKTDRPDIIILDVMMPKLNGLDLLQKLKTDPETRDIPVAMLTNLAGQADAEQAIAMGAVKYLIKSEFEPEQIVEIAREILKH